MRVLALLFLFIAASPIFPQQDPTPTLKAAVKGFRNSDRFKVDYDKFTDQARISVAFRPRGGTSFDTLTATALLNGDGTKTYYLEWEAISKGWHYLEHRGLYAIIDGQRAYLGEGSHDGKVSHVGRYDRVATVREELRFTIPAADFAAIANGKIVEVRVGRTEFKLKDEHLEAFRDLLSLDRRS